MAAVLEHGTDELRGCMKLARLLDPTVPKCHIVMRNCDIHQLREKLPHDMVWQQNWHHNSILSFTVPKTSKEANKRYSPSRPSLDRTPPPKIYIIEPPHE
ncbi:unnamed protein product [Sphenostylis stenocarpa]|uniref:Uncharacterized protein n=1 Tax=Sphenostylis stenocarpa TaxID=92480 RepID=A0AA86V4A8_9FABA|nr:unnamed protein product [Sphenostylis stenocarpa]